MKLTKEQIFDVLKVNCQTDYGAIAVMAALYKKIYGEFPKVGLSGNQAEMADKFVEQLP